MTAAASKIRSVAARAIKEPHKTAAALLFVFLLLLILKNPDIAIESMSEALRLCAATVIPSLFPFMVVSEIIISSNTVRMLAPLLEKPCKKLFGIGGEGSAAIILGMLCGSPIGAKCASSLYRQKKLTLNEYARLLTFSNNPSSAFLISAVGSAMFGNKSYGFLLYAISLLSAVTIGIAGARIGIKKAPETVENPVSGEGEAKKKSFALIFTSAISSSAKSMLNICAFVTFFSTLVSILEIIFKSVALPLWTKAIFFGFFEMTGGIYQASCCPTYGAYAAAFIAGWSGLSVHFQIMSICADDGVSFRPYIIAKLCQGLLNALLLALVCGVFGFSV